jgi:ubiquinone biosynthesis O-methyltransferase
MAILHNYQRNQLRLPNELIARLKNLSVATLWRHRIRKKIIFSLIDDGEFEILDVGCGIGDFAIELALRGSRVIGIDINQEEIKIAKELTANFKVDNVKFEIGDFFNFDFQNKKFDGILLCEVIEHFDNPSLILEKSHSLLREGGWVIISVPSVVSFRNRLVFFLKGIFPDNQEFHRYYFAKKDLLTKIKQAGFRVENIVGDFIPFYYGGLPWLSIKGFLARILPSLCYTIITKARKA